MILLKLKDWGKEASIHLFPNLLPLYLLPNVQAGIHSQTCRSLGWSHRDVKLAWYQYFIGNNAVHLPKQIDQSK